jgi:hypothetical protein
LLLACSGGPERDADRRSGAAPPSAASIVPLGLEVEARPGGAGVFNLMALTLREGELLVALRNEGGNPACSPSFSVELFDDGGQSLAVGGGGLLLRSFYRLTDGSGTLAGCVGPGEVSMAAIRDLPGEVAIKDVARIVYGLSYWNLQLTPVGGISITTERSAAGSGAVEFTGQLVNGLDVALTSPAVAIFSLDSQARPLGVAFARGAGEVAPGGNWDFETDPISDGGVDQTAYPLKGP